MSVTALGWHLVQMLAGHGAWLVQPSLILQLTFSSAANFPLHTHTRTYICTFSSAASFPLHMHTHVHIFQRCKLPPYTHTRTHVCTFSSAANFPLHTHTCAHFPAWQTSTYTHACTNHLQIDFIVIVVTAKLERIARCVFVKYKYVASNFVLELGLVLQQNIDSTH